MRLLCLIDTMRQYKYILLTKATNYSRQFSLLVSLIFGFLLISTYPGNAHADLDGAHIQALTSRTVIGIISYARWPVPPNTYRFCIVGDTAHVRTLTENSSEMAGRKFRFIMPVTDSELWLSECDILYFGVMARNQRLDILKKIKERTILTIGEGDEMCSDGMMFCFDPIEQKPVLQIDLDAIARSGIKINANVMLLLRNKATPR